VVGISAAIGHATHDRAMGVPPPRAFARVRIAAGIVLVGLGAVTLVGGSFTAKAVGWAMLFLAAAAGSFAGAAWDLAIARSASPGA